MQAPKVKFNFLSKLPFGKLADRILGEKPPSAQEISAMIAQNIQKSGAAAQNTGAASGADYKTMMEDIKKEVQKDVNTRLATFDTKAGDLEKTIREAKEISVQNREKLDAIEKNMKKFLSLYELVTNQVNPFIDNNAMHHNSGESSAEKHDAAHSAHAAHMKENKDAAHIPEQPKDVVKMSAEEKKIMGVVSTQGGYSETTHAGMIPENGKIERHMIDIREINPHDKKLVSIGEEIDLHSKSNEYEINPMEAEEKRVMHIETTGEYKHRDIGETLKNLLPLRSIKNDLCSLVTTLNWLRYLTEKAGPKGACDILKSYTTLGWITPEVYTILVKYITGMGGTPLEGQKIPEKKSYVPTVDDHMKSLFFISKLKGIDLEKEEYDKIVKKLTVLEDDLNGS